MKSRIVNVPSTKNIIQKSPGFEKKDLSEYKAGHITLSDTKWYIEGINPGLLEKTVLE